MKKMVRSGIFRFYLLSYSLVLFLPTLILSLVTYLIILPSYQQEILVSNRENLKKVATQVDEILNNLDYITSSIKTNPNLTPYILKGPNSYKAIRNLRMYCQANYLLEDIIYYIHGDEQIYSSKTSSDLNKFFAYIYPSDDWDKDYFQNEISSQMTKKATLFTTKLNNEYLAIIYPMDGNLAYMSLIYLISAEQLTTYIEGMSKSRDEQIIMTDENYDPLIYTGSSYPWMNLPEEEKLKVPQGSIVQEITGNNLFLTVFDLGHGNYKFISLIDNSLFMQTVYKLQFIFYITVAIIYVLGFTAIYFISKKELCPHK